MKFAIFTHVNHIQKGNHYYAYAPYVKEMNIWFKYVEKVEVIAPAIKISDSEFFAEENYEHSNITFTKVSNLDLLSLKGVFKTFFKLPAILITIILAMNRAEHLHLRCPGNIGLLACICQIFFPKKLKTAKYAGNWDPSAKQPWSYNLQKWILSNTVLTRNMQVLVYGNWPHQTENIKSFFTASFSEKEIDNCKGKSSDGEFAFIFSGNLVSGKNPLKAIKLVQQIKITNELNFKGPGVILDIYGDGPKRKMLENYCMENDLESLVQFWGNRTLEELKYAYNKAHFIILPSKSEGWPKAIAEGMFFGCIPIVTAVSCIPWMLAADSNTTNEVNKPVNITDRGILIRDFNKRRAKTQLLIESTAERVIELMNRPKEREEISSRAKTWSQQYTLEKFENSIKEILALQTINKEEI